MPVSVEERKTMGVIYLDFSKAFYAVSVSIVGALNWDVLV